MYNGIKVTTKNQDFNLKFVIQATFLKIISSCLLETSIVL